MSLDRETDEIEEEKTIIPILKRIFYKTHIIEGAIVLLGVALFITGGFVLLEDQIKWQISELVRWYISIGVAGQSQLFGFLLIIIGFILIIIKIRKKTGVDSVD